MNPNHFESEKLNYETSIRGVDSPATVKDAKRKILKGFLDQKSTNCSFTEIEVNIPFEQDCISVAESIAQITESVSKFQDSVTSPNYPRIASRLMHISDMKVTDSNNEEEATQRNLRSQLITLGAELAEIVETSNPRNNPPHSTPIASGSVPSNLTHLKKIPVY
ncbi:hypothetical protein HHI36_009828 [Cryptolaemus montrouzieri]|uniref:Uncharacterized protein n=1 Tax=Cryptolaemus montrouzieri TaxID=559131 RepID=A0ABD2MGY7_9CUCU